VFIPEDDSVVIGGVRYMLSVINLGAIAEDPNAFAVSAVVLAADPLLAVCQPARSVFGRAVHRRNRSCASSNGRAFGVEVIGLETILAQEPDAVVSGYELRPR